MDNTRLRIGFDARLAGPSHAGIGRYGEELLRRLLTYREIAGRGIDWIVWVHPDHQMPWLEQQAAVSAAQLRLTAVPHYGFLEQTTWVWELGLADLDLLHVPHFNVPLAYRGPYVLTIHDLLWHAQRDSRATTLSPWMHRLKHAAYRAVSESAIRRAAAVMVPSEVVKNDVAALTGRKQGVTVAYEGIADLYRHTADAVYPRENFICYTGSLYPHKNLEVVLSALRAIPKLKLKIASARSVFTSRLQERARALGVEKQVEWLGFVPDEELISLYQRARALVQPSKSEGFGLTGLEAMAVGCPVISSDIPIFREVYGSHSRFFNPDDPSALAGRLEESVPPAAQLKAAREHARGFSWDRMAAGTLGVYNSILARP